MKATCTCVRGSVCCYHMAAVMLHAHKTVSVTDSSCTWAAKSQKRQRNSGEPMSKVVPPRDFQVFKSPPCMEVIREKIIKKAKGFQDGEEAHIAWLLSPEPPVSKDVDTFIVKHPLDVILSREFQATECKLAFLNESLGITPEIIEQVALATVGQKKNPSWISVRQLRFTASRFGSILNVYLKKRNPGVPSQSLLKSLYEPPNLEKIKATQWGTEHESVALQKFCEEYKKDVSAAGIWLHRCGYIGASPDALVINEDAIVEVKCPYSFRNDKLFEVLKEDKNYFVSFIGDDLVLKTNHEYFHQIQGQLHLCKRSFAYVVLWTTKSMIVFTVFFVPSWVHNISCLQKFYCDHFVPYVLQRNL